MSGIEELPEDYKFVYKVKGCEHKVDFDTNAIVDKMLSTRTKKVNEEIIRHLRNIGNEKGINELILIDESKVLKIIKSLQAFEIIKKKNVNIEILKLSKDYFEYDAGTYKSIPLTQEEYDLLKEVLLWFSLVKGTN